MVKIVVDPVTRASPGLRVAVELKDGIATGIRVSGTSYRGFEEMLKGRDPADAVYFTRRICGMCSSSHAIASVNAVESLCEATDTIPKDALVIRNIQCALEWLKSHIENLYLSFLPDLADPVYRDVFMSSDTGGKVWSEFQKRFNVPGYASDYNTTPGEAYLEAIKCIKLIGQAEAILGGRSPHSPVIVPGGVTVRPTASDVYALKECHAYIAEFLRKRLLGTVMDLKEWLVKTDDNTGGQDYLWTLLRKLPVDDFSPEKGWGDLQLFLVFCSRMVSKDFFSYPCAIELDTIGGYPLSDQAIGFLNYGSFYRVRDESGRFKDGYVPIDTEKVNSYLMPSGFTPGSMPNIYAAAIKVDVTQVAEHVYSSFYSYADSKPSLTPYSGETTPVTGVDDIGYNGIKYSFVKAPRYAGVPCETGPLARLINSREGLLMNIMKLTYSMNAGKAKGREYPMTSVYTRVIARMQESLLTVSMLGDWLENDLEAGLPASRYCVPVEVKPKKSGVGFVEAPRGSLGHWVKVDGYGKITNYQTVSPTTWNASPADADSKSGPMELAMIGMKTMPMGNMPGSEANPTSVYHVIRSFDPCISCAVHCIRKR